MLVEVIAFLSNLGPKKCDEPSLVSIPVGKHVELHIEENKSHWLLIAFLLAALE